MSAKLFLCALCMLLSAYLAQAHSFEPTARQFTCVFPSVPNNKVDAWIDPMKHAFDYADIEDKSQVATFWAISGVLTLQYETFKEPGTRECREYDDGCDYTGRGALMLKGSSLYREAGRDLKRNYGSDPESLLQPADAFLSAGWLWKKRDMHDFGDNIGILELVAVAVKFQIYNPSDHEQMEVTYRRALECLEKDTTCTWYVVSKYDTPRIIADRLGYDLEDLVALNNWSGPNQALTEGESIKLSCHSS